MTQRFRTGSYELELTDEPTYTPGSADNVRAYDREYLSCARSGVTSRHGLVCREHGQMLGSAILLAGAGATIVHRHSLLVLGPRVYVAVGDQVMCLELPGLALVWKTQADPATVFGVYPTPMNEGLLVHGELEVSRLTLDGHVLWSVQGADIFTGEFTVFEEHLCVRDFEGRLYRLDLRSGRQTSA